MKYKVGDIVVWYYDDKVVAQITNVSNYSYECKFISHFSDFYLTLINSFNAPEFETFTRFLTDEEKLKLL